MNEKPDDPSSPIHFILEQGLPPKKFSMPDNSPQESNSVSIINDGAIVRIGTKTPDQSLSRLARARNHVVKLNPQKVNVSSSRSRINVRETADMSPSQTSAESPTNLLRNRRRLTNDNQSSEVYISRMSSTTPFGLENTSDNLLRQGSFDNSYFQEYNNGQKGLNQPPNMDQYVGQGILEEDAELAQTLRGISRIENRRGEEAKIEDNSWFFADEEYKEKMELPQGVNLDVSQTMNSQAPLSRSRRSSVRLVRIRQNSRSRSGSPNPRPNSGRTGPTEHDGLNTYTFRHEVPTTITSVRNTNAVRNREATVAPVTNTQQTQQANAPQEQTDNATRLLPKFEVERYIRKCLVLFIVLFFFSLLLVLCLKEQVPIHALAIPFYCYFVYLTGENIYCGYFAKNLATWQKRDDKLHILTSISCLTGFIVIDLKVADLITYSTYGAIPITLATVIYQLCSKAPNHTKSLLLAFKIICALQVLLVMAKLDKSLDVNWVYLFLPSLGFLAIMDTSFCIHAIMLFVLIIGILTGNYQDENMSNSLQFTGILWHFGYTGLNGLASFGIIALVGAFEPDGDTDMLFIASILSVFCTLFMIIYTIFVFKPLIEFFRIFYQDGGLIGSDAVPGPPPALPATISFKVEKKNSYFVTLSSTYFLPLTKNLMYKNRSNIEKIKTMFKDLKRGKDISKVANENEDASRQDKPIDTNTLHQYKRALDKKMSRVLEINTHSNGNSPTAAKNFTKLYTPRVEDQSPKAKNEVSFDEVDCAYNAKMALSAGNLAELIKQDVYSATKQRSEEERLCYLCYERPRDCVLMNCGHGGFCYECAIKAIKRKNECMECRGKVDAIHKIDLESQLTSIIKTVEVRKVVMVNNEVIVAQGNS